ncbi:MAG: outer membrane beta-barrel protein [Paracoccaceae bacterium]
MNRVSIILTSLICLMGSAASAESQLSFYGGHQSAPHSNVTGEYAGEPFDFTAGWEGKPLAMPPYYGVRYTAWRNNNWGIALDFAHAKVYSDDETREDTGFEVLEFTDGINVLTINAVRRFQRSGKWAPYIGGGIGIAIPNIEVQVDEDAVKTFEYQYGGPALQLHGGAEYRVNYRWSMFAEYKINYVILDVDLDGPSESFLKTNIITSALNVGVSYSF